MASFSEILSQVKGEIEEISATQTQDRMTSAEPPALIDVRERDEYEQGFVQGATWIPRGFLEIRIEDEVSDRDRPVILYCAAGSRSALAVRSLRELGYQRVYSMAGGFRAWKTAGLPFERPRVLTPEQLKRYSRHIMLPEVGEAGQGKLLDAKVLCLGAGGLGSPSALYLAAAGVGTIGIVDDDVVDESNLQRQVLHNLDRVGKLKVESAKQTLQGLNPDIKVNTYATRLNADNILDIAKDYDMIVDGADNFPTRYLVNDAALKLGIKVMHASIYRFEGQVTTFLPDQGPCYRCLYPEPPPPGMAPSCQDAGVLGVLPGMIGTMQANEALKEILGVGDSLSGRLLVMDALGSKTRVMKLRKDPNCPVCSKKPEDIELIDYENFCAI